MDIHISIIKLTMTVKLKWQKMKYKIDHDSKVNVRSRLKNQTNFGSEVKALRLQYQTYHDSEIDEGSWNVHLQLEGF